MGFTLISSLGSRNPQGSIETPKGAFLLSQIPNSTHPQMEKEEKAPQQQNLVAIWAAADFSYLCTSSDAGRRTFLSSEGLAVAKVGLQQQQLKHCLAQHPAVQTPAHWPLRGY